MIINAHHLKANKRTINGSVNNSFVSNKRNSKSNLRDKELHYSREHLYSNRSKSKKSDKRSMSNAIKKAKELYFIDETKSSPNQSSLRRDKSGFKNYDDSAIK